MREDIVRQDAYSVVLFDFNDKVLRGVLAAGRNGVIANVTLHLKIVQRTCAERGIAALPHGQRMIDRPVRLRRSPGCTSCG